MNIHLNKALLAGTVSQMFRSIYEYAIASEFDPITGVMADQLKTRVSELGEKMAHGRMQSEVDHVDMVQATMHLIDILDDEQEADPDFIAKTRIQSANLIDTALNTVVLVTGTLEPTIIEPEEYLGSRGIFVKRLDPSIFTYEELAEFAAFYNTYLFVNFITEDGGLFGNTLKVDALRTLSCQVSGQTVVAYTGPGAAEYLGGIDQYFDSSAIAGESVFSQVILDNLDEISNTFLGEMVACEHEANEKANYGDLSEQLEDEDEFVSDELDPDSERIDKVVRERNHMIGGNDDQQD